jgi:hypothetical protein
MAEEDVRVGLIGAGGIVQNHHILPTLAALEQGKHVPPEALMASTLQHLFVNRRAGKGN